MAANCCCELSCVCADVPGALAVLLQTCAGTPAADLLVVVCSQDQVAVETAAWLLAGLPKDA
jgi:hypothetical protein